MRLTPAPLRARLPRPPWPGRAPAYGPLIASEELLVAPTERLLPRRRGVEDGLDHDLARAAAGQLHGRRAEGRLLSEHHDAARRRGSEAGRRPDPRSGVGGETKPGA